MSAEQIPTERLEIRLTVDYDKPRTREENLKQQEYEEPDTNEDVEEYVRRAEVIAMGESWVARLDQVIEGIESPASPIRL